MAFFVIFFTIYKCKKNRRKAFFMKSNRKNDSIAEMKISEFMQKNFYSQTDKYFNHSAVFKKISTKEHQLDGIDELLIMDNSILYIDEKTDLLFRENPTTFCFELDSLQGKEKILRSGWLLNDNYTTHYFLLYPHKKPEVEEWGITDITSIEGVLLSKEKLLAYLKEEGLTIENMKKRAEIIRKKYKHSNQTEYSKSEKHPNIWFAYSGKIAEKPINLVIKKEILMNLADNCFTIYPVL